MKNQSTDSASSHPASGPEQGHTPVPFPNWFRSGPELCASWTTHVNGTVAEVSRDAGRACYGETTFTAWVHNHPELGSKKFEGRGALQAAKRAAAEMAKGVA